MTYRYDRALAFLGDGPKTLKQSDKDDHFVQSKLVVYKDANNAMQSYVIRIIPTEANRAKYKRVKADAFTGYMAMYNRDETQYLGGWTCKDGKAVGWYKAGGSKNGRLSETCYYTQYRPLGDDPPAHVGGGTDNRNYVTLGGTTYEVVSIAAPCPPDGTAGGGVNPTGGTGGPSPPDGGGGTPGSGGGDNGNLEFSRLYNFILDMIRDYSISFSNEEREIIRTYIDLTDVYL